MRNGPSWSVFHQERASCTGDLYHHELKTCPVEPRLTTCFSCAADGRCPDSERPGMFKRCERRKRDKRGLARHRRALSGRSTIRLCLSLWGVYVESIPSCRFVKPGQSLNMSTGLRRNRMSGQLICWRQLARPAIISIAGHHITATFSLCGGTTASLRRSNRCCLA